MALKFEVKCECQFIVGGLNFALHRERAGLSQQAVAERLTELTGEEIPRWVISRWENSYSFRTDLIGLLAIKKVLHIENSQ